MSIQPTFKKFLPVALMIGILAGATVYFCNMIASSDPKFYFFGAVWVPFITWALYFIGGAKISRAHKYLIGVVMGILYGWATIVVGNWLNVQIGPSLGYPITVFFVATSIVMLELTDWFELAPAYFFGYASFFAFVFGGFANSTIKFNPTDFTLVIYHAILSILGLLLGFVSYTLRVFILNKEGVPKEEQGTVFDRE